jgi:hypothetical protein
MIEQRWCTTDGRSWTLSHGKYWAYVEIIDINNTYLANTGIITEKPVELSWYDFHNNLWSGTFDCLKKAKSACIESIEDAEDIADAEAILADPYDTVISEVEP